MFFVVFSTRMSFPISKRTAALRLVLCFRRVAERLRLEGTSGVLERRRARAGGSSPF